MVTLSKKLLRTAGRTNAKYSLIQEGDRVVLGLSGGKDSLSLAHVLKHMQRHAPFDFEFKAVTVSYGIGEDFSRLIAHCQGHEIPHEVIHTDIMKIIMEKVRGNSSVCSFCARMRRGTLYTAALEKGYNKLALGHHIDDAAESFFMNLFYNGALRSMAPMYRAYNGLIVIRPLIHARERQLRACAEENNMPVMLCGGCPAMESDANKKPFARAKTKAFLEKMEREKPELFTSIASAFENIHEDSFFDSARFKLEPEKGESCREPD